MCSEWTSTNEASMSKTTGDVPVVADDRRHTSLRTGATASAMAERVVDVSWWKVRNTVVSEGTQPNRSSPRRRCSMSAQLSPPPASIKATWTKTLPRSCKGSRSPLHGMAAESASPSPIRSANAPMACRPTWATTPAPPGSTTTRFVLLAFTLEVPFLFGLLWLRHHQFPLLEGLFRGRGSVSSRGFVNGPG